MLSQIQAFLPGHPWKERIHYFDCIDSTNTRAKEMALLGAPHGTVLIADRQTGGRGRMGRSFQSPGGVGVYMSVLLRLKCPADQLMHLTCATAVAACDAVEAAVSLRPGIKWTNDLVCGNRKIAGILTELLCVGDEVCAVIGVGINCCQQEQDFAEDIRWFAGSLAMATEKSVDRAKVAASLIEALHKMDLGNKAQMMECYRKDCITIGKEVSLVRAEEVSHGYALCVDDEGGLVVRFADGQTKTVQSGEISVRGMYGYV
jgi:BirA family biotin operon repressor/biotin-[acetyl-CoA-carboxylase] ligase